MRMLRQACSQARILGQSLLMKITLPENVKYIIDTIEAHGFEAYAVGGCIRDSLLGRDPSDWDITTSAHTDDVKRIFDRTIDTGIEHGTVTVRVRGRSYEVTTFRIDGKYEDGRHPSEVKYTPDLEEDLKRRDFTINAMAYNDSRGLVDIFDGQGDLKKGIIRCVGDPEQRFSEDALRMMRAVRFSAQLDFDIDEPTAEAIRKLSETLRKVSAERIRVELEKLLVSDHPEKIHVMYELGLTSVFLPEWDAAEGCEQNTQHHCYDVAGHTMKTMQNVRADKVMRLAALLHDIGKPGMKKTDPKGTDHFTGHPQLSDVLADRILHRLKYDNDTIRKVRALVKFHDERPVVTRKNVRRYAAHMGDVFPELFELRRADVMAQSKYMRTEKLKAIDDFEEYLKEIRDNNECIAIRDLAVNGRDLIQAGIKAGPELGCILNALLKRVIDEPELNDRETLLKIAQEIK